MPKKNFSSITGIMGKAGSGKDTTASVFSEYVNKYYKYSFADPLKVMCSHVFDIPIVAMYNQDLKKEQVYVTPHNKHVRERMANWVLVNIVKVEHWHHLLMKQSLNAGRGGNEFRYQDIADKLLDRLNNLLFDRSTTGDGVKHTYEFATQNSCYSLSVRLLLQLFGTDIIRNYLDDQFWSEVKNDASGYSVFVPDCRFKTEVDYILNNNGRIIIVKNPDLVIDPELDSHESERFVDEVEEYIQTNYRHAKYYVVENGFSEDSMNKLREQVNNIVNWERI